MAWPGLAWPVKAAALPVRVFGLGTETEAHRRAWPSRVGRSLRRSGLPTVHAAQHLIGSSCHQNACQRCTACQPRVMAEARSQLCRTARYHMVRHSLARRASAVCRSDRAGASLGADVTSLGADVTSLGADVRVSEIGDRRGGDQRRRAVQKYRGARERVHRLPILPQCARPWPRSMPATLPRSNTP